MQSGYHYTHIPTLYLKQLRPRERGKQGGHSAAATKAGLDLRSLESLQQSGIRSGSKSESHP